MGVTVGADRGELTAEAADTGMGFDPNVAQGSGLTGLADRIQALGGLLTVDSQPDAGPRLIARFPVETTNATSS